MTPQSLVRNALVWRQRAPSPPLPIQLGSTGGRKQQAAGTLPLRGIRAQPRAFAGWRESISLKVHEK